MAESQQGLLFGDAPRIALVQEETFVLEPELQEHAFGYACEDGELLRRRRLESSLDSVEPTLEAVPVRDGAETRVRFCLPRERCRSVFAGVQNGSACFFGLLPWREATIIAEVLRNAPRNFLIQGWTLP